MSWRCFGVGIFCCQGCSPGHGFCLRWPSIPGSLNVQVRETQPPTKCWNLSLILKDTYAVAWGYHGKSALRRCADAALAPAPSGSAAAAAVPAVSWIASVWLCGYAVLCVMWAQPALRCALCCLCCLWAVASTIIRCGHVANQTVHSDSHIREDRKQKRKMGTGETFGVRKPCRTVFFFEKNGRDADYEK